MNIDHLLKHIYPLIEESIADFAKETQKILDESLERAWKTEDVDGFEMCIASFNANASQLNKLMMLNLQAELAELSGDRLENLSSAYAVSMTSDDLKLLEKEDVEEQIALESMAHMAINSVAKEINLLTQRFSLVFEIEGIDERLNPLGPYLFAKNFGKACKTINAPPKQRLVIFKVFEEKVLTRLNDILIKANEYLIELGVMTDASPVHKSREDTETNNNKEASSGSNSEKGSSHRATQVEKGLLDEQVEPIADLDLSTSSDNSDTSQEEMLSILSDEFNTTQQLNAIQVDSSKRTFMPNIPDKMVRKIYEMITDEGGYNVLQKLFEDASDGPETRISSSGLNDQNFSEKKEIVDEELLEILTKLQVKNVNQQDIPILNGVYEKNTIAQDIGNALQEKSNELGAETTLTKGDNDLINLVDMLFNFILSNDYLSDSVKLVISDLQAPITKVALLDKNFFSDAKHPARQLLNELSKTGMSISQETDVVSDKTVENISGAIKGINEKFDVETSVFEQALEEFSEETEKQLKRTELLEQRLVDAEEGRAKYKNAESIVDELYTQMRIKVPTSKTVDLFLDTAWRDVLIMTCLRFGSSSKNWVADKKVTKKFMNSILVAKKTRLDNKRMKPPVTLLNLLKKALVRISYDSVESKKLLIDIAKEYQTIAKTAPEDIEQEFVLLKKESATTMILTPPTTNGVIAEDDSVVSDQPPVIELVESEVTTNDLADDKESDEAKLAVQNNELGDEAVTEEQTATKQDSEPEYQSEPAANVEKEPPQEKFVQGNQWFDMAVQIPIGSWLDIKQEELDGVLRCKLVANIKSLDLLVFANKSGIKVADRKINIFAAELRNGESKVVNDNSIFDQALENVIVNLRSPDSK